MLEHRFGPGETIYRQGDPSDAVYFISDGDVELLRETAEGPVSLAHLGRGQIFGEVGVIRSMPRSTTVRATTETRACLLSAEQFMQSFSSNGGMALQVLRMLCERLVLADQQITRDRPPPVREDARLGAIKQIRILANSPLIEREIGNEGIVVEQLPFRVGRRLLRDEPALRTETQLSIPVHEQYQLSPEHFAIEDQNGIVMVRDLGSHLGTLVNGRRIASFEHASAAALYPGENTVQAGGLQSPYSFRVMIEPMA